MTNPKSSTTAKCTICGKSFPKKKMMPAELIRNGVAEAIKKDNPGWVAEGHVCINDLNYYRGKHVEMVIATEKGDTSKLERRVIKSLKEHEIISENVNSEFDSQLTFGERISDKVAEFGGSWKFIISFGIVILIWIVFNTLVLLNKPFDPYPYILLNLVLSCLAALQAPIIMMSQNRQEDKDRLRSEHDYSVNLKAELEIRHLNEKMDHLLNKQWHRLLEIQQIQLDFMEELTREKLKKTIVTAPVTSTSSASAKTDVTPPPASGISSANSPVVPPAK